MRKLTAIRDDLLHGSTVDVWNIDMKSYSSFSEEKLQFSSSSLSQLREGDSLQFSKQVICFRFAAHFEADRPTSSAMNAERVMPPCRKSAAVTSIKLQCMKEI